MSENNLDFAHFCADTAQRASASRSVESKHTDAQSSLIKTEMSKFSAQIRVGASPLGYVLSGGTLTKVNICVERFNLLVPHCVCLQAIRNGET